MTQLTDDQRSLLNIYGSVKLRKLVSNGDLPDCPEVNARIATRCLWENAHSWNFSKWFFADYVNAQFRSGRVSVRKVVLPNEEVRYTVVAPGGRWSDFLTEDQAKKHLRSHRKDGRLVRLNTAEIENAERDLTWALSR